jgi:hypothetical protein
VELIKKEKPESLPSFVKPWLRIVASEEEEEEAAATRTTTEEEEEEEEEEEGRYCCRIATITRRKEKEAER